MLFRSCWWTFRLLLGTVLKITLQWASSRALGALQVSEQSFGGTFEHPLGWETGRRVADPFISFPPLHTQLLDYGAPSQPAVSSRGGFPKDASDGAAEP